MKRVGGAIAAIALLATIYYVYSLAPSVLSNPAKVIQVETALTPFHGKLRGIPCVEKADGAECFLVVEK